MVVLTLGDLRLLARLRVVDPDVRPGELVLRVVRVVPHLLPLLPLLLVGAVGLLGVGDLVVRRSNT